MIQKLCHEECNGHLHRIGKQHGMGREQRHIGQLLQLHLRPDVAFQGHNGEWLEIWLTCLQPAQTRHRHDKRQPPVGPGIGVYNEFRFAIFERMQYNGLRFHFHAAKLAKKMQKRAFSFKKIWQNGKKAVLLHPLLL